MSHGSFGMYQQHSRRFGRGGALAALLLAAGIACALVAAPAQAAPLPQQPGNGPSLSVSPSSRVSATNAEVTVRGSGYNGDGELWVAVCQDDGVAPQQFADCLGGAIPNANGSSSWAVITPDGNPRYAGPVTGKFGGRGQFKVTLQLAVAVGQDADCVNASCSVYTRSADPGDRSQDASTPITFAVPRTTSSAAPSTEVIGGAPTTVAPDSVSAPNISPGDEQTVVFSNFQPKEAVDVTLFSDPIKLPAVAANGAGVVTVTFTVPPDLPLGEHLLQAVGRSSGLIGVAPFAVVETLATTTDATASTETTATTDSTAQTTESAAATDDPLMTALDTPETTDSSSSAETSTAETTASAADDAATTESAVIAPEETSGNRLVWLWIALAALVILGGGAAAVALLMRRRRGPGDGERGSLNGVFGGAPGPSGLDDEPAVAPSWEAMRTPAATEQTAAPAPATEWPLYGGSEPAPVSPATAVAPGTPGAAPAYDGGPATEQFRPVFADDDHRAAAPDWTALPEDDEAVTQAVDALDVADARDYLGDDPTPSRGRHSSD